MTTEIIANFGAIIGIFIVTAMGIILIKATNKMYRKPEVEKKG